MINIELGIDIVDIKRIKSMVETYGDKFLNKIFSRSELDEAQKKGHFIQSLAGKFAAKEAFFKTQPVNILEFQKIEILSKTNGKPYCIFNGVEVKNCILSISHEKHYAVAAAIFFKN